MTHALVLQDTIVLPEEGTIRCVGIAKERHVGVETYCVTTERSEPASDMRGSKLGEM